MNNEGKAALNAEDKSAPEGPTEHKERNRHNQMVMCVVRIVCLRLYYVILLFSKLVWSMYC